MSSLGAEEENKRLPLRPMDGQLPGGTAPHIGSPQAQTHTSVLHVPPPPSASAVEAPRHETTRAFTAPRPAPQAMGRRTLPGAASLPRERRQSRRAMLKRQQRLRVAAWVAAGLVILVSFQAGRKMGAAAGRTPVDRPVIAERRESALRAMDEAVKAKHEGKLQEAMLAAEDAKRLDPRVRGADLLRLEVAFLQQDWENLMALVDEAVRKGHNLADANLLHALYAWLTRATNPQQEAVAMKKLAEAADDQLSNPGVGFLQAQVLGAKGLNEESGRALAESMYRRMPWMSETVLAAKMKLAQQEAKEIFSKKPAKDDVVIESRAGEIMVALRQKLRAGQDASGVLQELQTMVVAKQLQELLDDVAYDMPVPQDALRRAREVEPMPIPVVGGNKS